MTRNATAQKIARRAGLLAALAGVALMVAPAAGMASSPVKFGSKLNPTVQPSNSLPGLTCNGPETPSVACTMVQNEAYGRPGGGELAPKTGKIRLIADGPGSFKLQVAKVKQATNEAKVVSSDPRISYQGQTELNFEDDSYRVESSGERAGEEGPAARPARQRHLDGPLLLGRRQHPDLQPAAFPRLPLRRDHQHRRLLAADGSSNPLTRGRVVTYAGHRRPE
jgi:hypothetical protein